MLFPFIEQPGLYEYIALRQFRNNFGSQWWLTEPGNAPGGGVTLMNDEIRRQFGGVSAYRCPSRRGGGVQIPTFPAGATPVNPQDRPQYGPHGCYAIVISFQGNEETVASGAVFNDWPRSASDRPGGVSGHRGPIRLSAYGVPPGNDEAFNRWQPRDTLSWWQDGTSNQIVVGEKHLPPLALNKCESTGGLTASDCSYLIPTGDPVTMARRVRVAGATTLDMDSGTYFLRRPNDELTSAGVMNNDVRHEFGSAHPIIVNFLIGDGSVRAFSLTTPGGVLARLGTVDDGETVNLP